MKFENENAWKVLDNFLLDCSEISQEEREQLMGFIEFEEKTEVNLDELFEKWKSENEENLKEKFLDVHDFNNYLEEEWQRYQRENGL